MAWGPRALLAVCALSPAACGHTAATGSGAAGSGTKRSGPAGTVSGATSAIAASGRGATADVARAPGADWPTFDFNAQCSGLGPTRTGITASNLSGGRTILPPGSYHDSTSTSRIEIYHLPGS